MPIRTKKEVVRWTFRVTFFPYTETIKKNLCNYYSNPMLEKKIKGAQGLCPW